MKISKISVLLPFAFALCFSLFSAPAHAQATRTWVSGVGDDANPCSRTAPCKTFAGAISKTAPAGEINVLDPGGFGAVTITKSITISSVAFEAGVLVSGTNGIVVSAGATDQVVLEGLDIEGLGTGLDGVKVTAANVVYILRSKIHHFTGNGVNMNSSTANSQVIIKDSLITQNATGVNVNGNGVVNTGLVTNTVIDGNTTNALAVNGAGGAGTSATIEHTFLTNSPTKINLTNGGTATCVGPSNFIGGPTTCTSGVNYK
jgi:hypothetical protein